MSEERVGLVCTEAGLPIDLPPEAQLVQLLEQAGQMLAAAITLNDARRVEGFMRATLEWLKRQQGVSLSLFNASIYLWLEGQVKQGEILAGLERSQGGRPKNPHHDGAGFERSPPLRELGYARITAHRLQLMAAVPSEERQRLAMKATEDGAKLTQKALIEFARKQSSKNGKQAGAANSAERSPCPVELPADFHNTVVTGDARELARQLPDSSIGLCLCDPVYDRLGDYEWLAEECERVLVPGGSLIVQCGNSRRFDCEVAMRRSSLEFVDLIAEVYPYAINRLFKAKVFVGWKPYLWFSRGSRKSGWINNRLSIKGGKPTADDAKEIHPWGDSDQMATALIKLLIEQGEVVWDPFTGSGTVPAAAAKLGVPFVAFEIDPGTAERARERIAGTPRSQAVQPLLCLEAES